MRSSGSPPRPTSTTATASCPCSRNTTACLGERFSSRSSLTMQVQFRYWLRLPHIAKLRGYARPEAEDKPQGSLQRSRRPQAFPTPDKRESACLSCTVFPSSRLAGFRYFAAVPYFDSTSHLRMAPHPPIEYDQY